MSERLKRNLKKTTAYLRFIGLAIFIYILSKVDYLFLYKSLRNTDGKYIILVLLLVILFIVIRALRWRAVLQNANIFISPFDSFIINTAGLFYGFITPGRVGDLSVIYSLNKKGFPKFASFNATIVDRFLDILFLFLFFAASIIFYPDILDKGLVYTTIGGLILLLLFSMSLTFKSIRTRIKDIFEKIVIDNIKKKIDFSTDKSILTSIKQILTGNLHIIIPLTIMMWAVLFLSRYVMIESLHLKINFFYLILCISLSMIVTSIPISIGGFGTRDAVLIYFFMQKGFEKELALIFSFYIVLTYFFTSIIGFFCVFIIGRSQRRADG